MITCHVCGSTDVTHYKQRRVDGVWVVTARCINGHIPEKNRPFYPISQFDIASLPMLGKTREEENAEQERLFVSPSEMDSPIDNLLDMLENKRRISRMFPRLK